MKKKLPLDTVCLIFALKRHFGDSKSILEAFRNYWCGYNADYRYMKPEDYGYKDIRLILRRAFIEMLEAADYPAGLYRSYFEQLDSYNEFYLSYTKGQYLTEDEKKAGDEIYALLVAIKGVQVREEINGKYKCINGFTEKLIKEADKLLDEQEKKFADFKNSSNK